MKIGVCDTCGNIVDTDELTECRCRRNVCLGCLYAPRINYCICPVCYQEDVQKAMEIASTGGLS